MMFDWPIVAWFLDSLKKAFPPARTGQIVEDPDDLGFFWVWDDFEDDMSDFVWDDIDHIEEMRAVGDFDCDKCLLLVFGDEENDDER